MRREQHSFFKYYHIPIFFHQTLLSTYSSLGETVDVDSSSSSSSTLVYTVEPCMIENHAWLENKLKNINFFGYTEIFFNDNF